MDDIFPSEITQAASGINHEIKRRILSTLVLKGKMSYSELRAEVSVDKGTLNYHLGLLLDSGLISNYIRGKNSTSSKHLSYYEISSFGRSFIDSLFESLMPMDSNHISRQISNRVQRNKLLFLGNDSKLFISERLYRDLVPLISTHLESENLGSTVNSSVDAMNNFKKLPVEIRKNPHAWADQQNLLVNQVSKNRRLENVKITI